MSGSILIVDDEVQLTLHLETLLGREGYATVVAHSGKEARREMARFCPEVVLLDLRLGEDNGAELMRELRPDHKDTQFIIITAHGSIASAVSCLRDGAFDYLTKPFDPEELLVTVRNAISRDLLRDEVRRLRDTVSGESLRQTAGLTSRSPAMKEVEFRAGRAAEQDGIVLLLGETGTGKDYLARWIHDRSTRSGGPFFVVNCATLTRELADSELFGHEPGAFTGSRRRKRGLVEVAAGGTLLLNEIGELDLALQAKLLTFLDSKSFLRVGGEKTITVDVRILSATNRDLEQEVQAGKFRQDLYYRLAVMPLRLPPLRHRREDVPDLAGLILMDLSKAIVGREPPQLTEGALEILQAYSWPGNIRELRNVLERTLLLSPGKHLGPEVLGLESGSAGDGPALPVTSSWNLHESTKQVARALVQQALLRSGSKREAAELLGISRHALAHQLKALDLDS